jgi:hypothetical protein
MGSAALNITGYKLYNIYIANIWLHMENKVYVLSGGANPVGRQFLNIVLIQ